MSSSVSDLVFTGAVIGTFLTVILLLRHYLPLRTTPSYLLVPVFLALVLPASIILLVPIDLASSATTGDGAAKGIWLAEGARLVLWRITYWLTFVLTWIILPILGEYVDSGYRDPRARIIYSLRMNVRYQVITLACGIIGGIYFFWESGFRPTSIKGLVMALAYAWGLILAIYLMGNGLVAIPKRLYRSASTTRRLKHLQTQAPKIHDRLASAIEDLEQLEAQVVLLQQRKTGTGREFQEWIQELAETSELPESRGGLAPAPLSEHVAIPAVITERYLADLTRKLKRARHKRVRFIQEWDRLVKDAKACQAIIDAAPSQRLEFTKTTTSNDWYDKIKIFTPFTRYHFYANVLPKLRLVASGVLALASVCIIWSEVFKSAVPKLSIVGLSIIHHPNSETGKIGFAGQVMAAAWLCYMCTATLASISEVKVWGNRALVPRHTYSESACWYAGQVAKLTVPLAFNFVTFMPQDIIENTTFYQFLGRLIDLTPISTGFSDWFPIFILVSALATTFNLYGKIKNIAGFGVLEDDSEDNPDGFGTGGWREGRTLIDHEIRSTDSQSLGLSTRDHSPTPSISRTPTSAPFSNSRIDSFSNAVAPSSVAPPTRRERQQIISKPLPADEEGEGNFFQDFAHRVKNTLDTTQRPEWMAKIQKPKWMAGVGGNTETSGRSEFGQGLSRWFGRPDDGKVRI